MRRVKRKANFTERSEEKKTPNQRKEKIICLITNWRTFVSKHIYIRWILWVVPLSTACSHIGHKLFTIKIYTHYIYIGFKAKERSQTCTSHDVTTTTTTEFVTFFCLAWNDCFFSIVVIVCTHLSFEYYCLQFFHYLNSTKWELCEGKKLNEKNEH